MSRSCARRSAGRSRRRRSDPLDVIEELVTRRRAGRGRDPRAAATSATSSAARSRARSPRTGSRRLGSVRRPRVARASAAVVEEIAGEWLKELLGLPPSASFAFTTGCQMAHVTCTRRGSARGTRARGLGRRERTGSPAHRRSRVVAGAKRHVTIDRALRLLGSASATDSTSSTSTTRVEWIDALRDVLYARSSGPTIVCAQAGEVNTGAFDPDRGDRRRRARAGAWLHVDGAFGLWAAASARLRHLDRGHRPAPIRGRPTGTSGSTSRTTAGSRSARPDAHRASMRHDGGVLRGPDPNAGRDAAGLDAGVLAARTRVRRVRGAAFARTRRRRRPRRPLLRPRARASRARSRDSRAASS